MISKTFSLSYTLRDKNEQETAKNNLRKKTAQNILRICFQRLVPLTLEGIVFSNYTMFNIQTWIITTLLRFSYP